MHFAAWFLLVLLPLPLAAQQQKGKGSPTKGPIPVLTAAEYAELIVTRSDVVNGLNGLIPRGKEGCLFSVDTIKAKVDAQAVAVHVGVWASKGVQEPLRTSHGEILAWMKKAQSELLAAPDCFRGALNMTEAQRNYLRTFNGYESLRKNAESALALVGVTLPPATK